MVKIAIAAGTSNFALELTDAIVATGKHSLLLLSRRDVPSSDPRQGVSWAKTSYQDADELADIFQGVHTVLSCVTSDADVDNKTQINLIEACVKAGVKRFAPSEWATSSFEHLRFYENKAFMRRYLANLNKDKKVVEYTLFQPGLFTNYFAHPLQSSKHFTTFEIMIDFKNRRAFIPEDGEKGILTLTTVQDCARLVSAAVDYQGEWPVDGSMNGGDISIGDLLKLGENIRGGPFEITHLARSDLEAGKLKTTWMPVLDHPSIPKDKSEEVIPPMLAGLSLSMHDGAWKVGNAWNKLLPEFRFTGIEEFLREQWKGKA